MAKKNSSDKAFIVKRVKEILDSIELEREGLAAFLGLKPLPFQDFLKGRNGISAKKLARLLSAYSIRENDFYDPNFKLSENLYISKEMKAFLKEHKNVRAFFKATHSRALPSWFIKEHLLNAGFLDKPVTTGEILAECLRIGGKLDIKGVNNAMAYMVTSKQVKGQQKPIIKKNGEIGKRRIWYYWKNKRSTGL